MEKPRIAKPFIFKVLGAAVVLWLAFTLFTLRHGDRHLYPAGPNGVTVYVINNGFHTDIAVPAEAVRSGRGAMVEAAAMAGPHRWLVYGWGDAGFFTARGVSLARVIDGLRALFMVGNPSVIRIYGVDRAPDDLYGKSVAVPVVLSAEGFAAMERHIGASMALRHGRPMLAIDENDGFYFFASVEHFSAVRVCNNWTSDQLSAAGLPMTPAIDGLAPLLSFDLRMRAHVRP